MSDVTKTSKEFDIVEINGIKLKINPFPPGMYEAIMNDVIKEIPLPEIPQKEIDVFGGQKEMVDIESGDEGWDEYNKQKTELEKKRDRTMSERILKFVMNECLEITNPKKMNQDIKRLSQYTGFPDDELERQNKYISSYVLKTKNHYEKVIKTAIALSVIDDAEVAERLESFQD
jgi:hypothetical protein